MIASRSMGLDVVAYDGALSDAALDLMGKSVGADELFSETKAIGPM